MWEDAKTSLAVFVGGVSDDYSECGEFLLIYLNLLMTTSFRMLVLGNIIIFVLYLFGLGLLLLNNLLGSKIFLRWVLIIAKAFF